MSLSMCIRVCMPRLYTHACRNVYTCLYPCPYACVLTYVHDASLMRGHMPASMAVQMSPCMSRHVPAHVSTHRCIRMPARISVHLSIHMPIRVSPNILKIASQSPARTQASPGHSSAAPPNGLWLTRPRVRTKRVISYGQRPRPIAARMLLPAPTAGSAWPAAALLGALGASFFF